MCHVLFAAVLGGLAAWAGSIPEHENLVARPAQVRAAAGCYAFRTLEWEAGYWTWEPDTLQAPPLLELSSALAPRVPNTFVPGGAYQVLPQPDSVRSYRAARRYLTSPDTAYVFWTTHGWTHGHEISFAFRPDSSDARFRFYTDA